MKNGSNSRAVAFDLDIGSALNADYAKSQYELFNGLRQRLWLSPIRLFAGGVKSARLHPLSPASRASLDLQYKSLFFMRLCNGRCPFCGGA